MGFRTGTREAGTGADISHGHPGTHAGRLYPGVRDWNCAQPRFSSSSRRSSALPPEAPWPFCPTPGTISRDVLGLVVAFGSAAEWRNRGASPRFTYGLKKASILAALINSLFLLIAVGADRRRGHSARLFHPSR